MTKRVQWSLLAAIYVILVSAATIGFFARFGSWDPSVLGRFRDTAEDFSQGVSLLPGSNTSPKPAAAAPLTVSNIDIIRAEIVQDAQLQAAQQRFLHATPSGSVARQVDVFFLTFDTTLPDGTTAPVRAKVFVPHVNAAKSPLFVFASGTTGIGDNCAPTRERAHEANWGDYQSHLLTQAANGFVVVLPDYIGFNELSREQAYFLSEYEARTVVGSLLALDQVSQRDFGTTPDFQNIFLSGYSQGGHSAMSAASHPEMWNSQHKLKGIISYAGASDVEALLSDSPRLAPYLVIAFQHYFDLGDEPNQILRNTGVDSLIPPARQLCVDQVIASFPNTIDKVYSDAAAAALKQGTLETVAPRFTQEIRANSVFPTYPLDVPMLSLQGATDPIVTAATQRNNTQEFCAQGLNLEYKEYAGVNHFGIRKAGFEDTAAWLQARLAGQPTRSTCL